VGELAVRKRDAAGRRDERAPEAEDVGSKLNKLFQRDLGRHRVLIAVATDEHPRTHAGWAASPGERKGRKMLGFFNLDLPLDG